MFLGIDVGSQSLKAVLLDDALRTVGRGARSYPIAFPQPGWAEQHPALWEAALAPAVAEALAAAGRGPSAVLAIGIAGQLDGSVGVDAHGRALGPCLIWMDRRADATLTPIHERWLPEQFRRRTGANLDGSHMAPKIRWQLDHQPEARAAVRFHQPVSYLVERLTGEAVMDHGLASTTLAYDLQAADFADDLLGLFGLERRLLPRLAASEAVAGRLTATGAALLGLPPGLPVAVGTGDDFATPLGGGVAEPGIVANVLGTAEVVGALDPRPLIDDGGLVETHRYVGSQLHYIENPGWLSGGALEWLRALLQLPDFSAFDAAAAAAPAGCDGLTFLPALTGAMTPEWNAAARGCFYGLTPSHGVAHLARAALEGTAFGLRDVIDRLQALGVPAERVRILGGGARSRLWAQIRADVSGLPAERSAVADASAVGAALLAAVAGGAQPDVATAARRVGAVAETAEPRPEEARVYDDAYARYRRLFSSVKAMFACDAAGGAGGGREIGQST
jgi:xylulokinase